MKQFRWHTWPQSPSTNNYALHIQYQFISTSIHWHFHSNPNLPPKLNRNFSLTLYRRHTSLYTMHVIPRPITINWLWGLCFTASEIRVSSMLLLLMIGNWNLRLCDGFQMYDVIYRDIRPAGSTDEASGHTQTVRQYKQRTDPLNGNESLLKPKLLTSPCCSCVCL
jgi:hypothetical protein